MSAYNPNYFLKNGHINTIYTSLYRKAPVLEFSRERILTHDEDFIDLDLIKRGHSRLAILCHGLEGSSSSKYIQGTGDLLSENGYDICAMNYRFCSGEINIKPQMYHSGWTPDLHTVVEVMEAGYEEIVLIGFSLGGNLVLKYAGENLYPLSAKITAVCAVSVPLNLLSSSLQMERMENYFYTKRFLKTLNHKIQLKADQFPNLIDTSHISKIKTVKDFDDFYTGPLNGYKDAKDYYEKCSADQFLPDIAIPTLIISALDDPFLGSMCFPREEVIGNPYIKTDYTKHGGHVGFFQKGRHMYNEEKILAFLK